MLALTDRTVLHLGSGRKYDISAINVDLVASTSPDVVHNLDVFPWPFDDDRFKEVRAFDVIEHLDNIVTVMQEIHRISQDGALIKITVPHFSCVNAFTDITHRHFFSTSSFDYFTGDNEFDFYSTSKFKKIRSTIVFFPGLINKFVWRIANFRPRLYERRWAWMFPAWYLYFELSVVKSLAE